MKYELRYDRHDVKYVVSWDGGAETFANSHANLVWNWLGNVALEPGDTLEWICD
ncbi:hypothetical protein [Mycobacterium sp. CnD-18-1]|uniref:DUF7372 domain-containing protein n=1 Tax=Mycobacterium sp. CnD-18-1 TaxID=2917744 RepID=UPI001EF168BE|nr:hypothetical protein [Mycobacterium sp. CnD-18-1]MCG7607173.1 hypothetical protein [Mycobacterium sp. CnD-18-1]